MPTLRTISAFFTDKTQNETTDCLPFSEGLKTGKGFCDLSPKNDGMPWFCEMPVTPGLTCQHVSRVTREEYDRDEIEKTVPSAVWR